MGHPVRLASAEKAVEMAIDDSQGIEINSADVHSIVPSGRPEDVGIAGPPQIVSS